MGLLEYQAMPSLRDIAHAGVFCTFSKISPRTGESVVVRESRRHGHHVQNHTCWVTLLQPARWASVLGQPCSLRPHRSIPAARMDRTAYPGWSCSQCSAVSFWQFQLLLLLEYYRVYIVHCIPTVITEITDGGPGHLPSTKEHAFFLKLEFQSLNLAG
jgi:hypothetical protein